MKKKLVLALVVLVLLVGLFAPVVRQASLSLAAERPAAAQMAYTLPDGGTVVPTKPGPVYQPCVGWNS
jgi:hypothetical protein